jgi:hypothetical protein
MRMRLQGVEVRPLYGALASAHRWWIAPQAQGRRR